MNPEHIPSESFDNSELAAASRELSEALHEAREAANDMDMRRVNIDDPTERMLADIVSDDLDEEAKRREQPSQ